MAPILLIWFLNSFLFERRLSILARKGDANQILPCPPSADCSFKLLSHGPSDSSGIQVVYSWRGRGKKGFEFRLTAGTSPGLLEDTCCTRQNSCIGSRQDRSISMRETIRGIS